MEGYGVFLSNLRSSAGLSQEELGRLVGTSKSTVSRLENGDIPQPFKGSMRSMVLMLSQLLCTSSKESERYLNLAGIDRSLLTDSEEMLLGFTPHVAPGSPDEMVNLIRLEQIYCQMLAQLEMREIDFGISSSPPKLKLKIQEYTNILKEIRQRLDVLTSKQEPMTEKTMVQQDVYYASAPEGKIIVGFNYGETLSADIVQYSLHNLASKNARRLLELADVEHFAVDDCVILTNSPNFRGWSPDEIRTTVLRDRLPIPDDLEELRQSKLPAIEKDFFNSSHYRLVSFSPSFVDLDRLDVTLAPLNFHEYYAITPFFDEPLLRALDGSAISVRQKYGNTSLSFSSTERGTSLIPTPISLQCVVVTADQQIILMRRSASVAFYPNHWSASFEETMNAPGTNRKGEPSRSDDADFFAGAIRGLEEEFAIPADAVESIKVLSLNVEYLTLSTDVLMVIRVSLDGEEIRQNWSLEAWDRDEASKFALLPADIESVTRKLFDKTLWHPTARMRLIQYLFHAHSVKEVKQALKTR